MRASDRMSRSEMSLLLPSPPTALQVLTADIVNGIIESKNLHVCAVCSKWARWAVREAAGMWDILVVVLQCRSWFHFQSGLWFSRPPFTVAGRATF